ncbi:hypothetical protein SK128_000263, partial [Halocaridina rubra]
MESDLVGLRAELQKKKAEASKHGGGKKGIPKRQVDKLQKPSSFNIKNADIALNYEKSRDPEKEETPSEETIKGILERKAQLYEKLHNGIEALDDDNIKEKYMVDFQKKIVDEVNDMKMRKEKELERKAKHPRREEAEPENYKASKEEEE